MANIKSSIKDIRKTIKRRKRNIHSRSIIKTYIKKVRNAIQSGNKNSALNEFKIMQPILDRYATKGLIHKNKAARHKSILSHQINKLT